MQSAPFRILVAATAATAGLMLSSFVPAAAATAPVAIHKIAGQKVGYHKKATIEPSVSAMSNVELKSKTLTVKKGKKTVAKNKKSVKLKAGKYKVTTKVKYRTSKEVVDVSYQDQTVVEVPQGVAVDASCEIESAQVTPAVDPDPVTAALALVCTGEAFTSSENLGATASENAPGTWDVVVPTDTTGPHQIVADDLTGQLLQVVIAFDHDLTRVDHIRVESPRTVWSGTKTKTRTQKLVIKQKKRPSRTDPVDAWHCPKWAPIKGNAQSMIYHLPGQRFYTRTKPEDCFSTEKAARAAGYRKSKV